MDENEEPSLSRGQVFENAIKHKIKKSNSPLAEVQVNISPTSSDSDKSFQGDSPTSRSFSFASSKSDLSNRSMEVPRENPFENDILAGLDRSFCTGNRSLMEVKDTDSSPESERFWNIDQQSKLFPKDIENSPTSHQNEVLLDPHVEAKAQDDIDKYFQRRVIVPTPSPGAEYNPSPSSPLTKNTSFATPTTGRKLDFCESASEDEDISPTRPYSSPGLMHKVLQLLTKHEIHSPGSSGSPCGTGKYVRRDEYSRNDLSVSLPDTPGVSPIGAGPSRIRKSTDNSNESPPPTKKRLMSIE